jgi:serine O-acetyltransferase
MSKSLKILNLDKDQLLNYIIKQLNFFIPDQIEIDKLLLKKNLPLALSRLHKCINSVKLWNKDKFDYLHSSQYCIFVYFLSNTIWKQSGDTILPTKLFILNKALNGIDLFYEVEMPEHFFIGHSVGIVLAKAKYGDYLVLYQNSTVGKSRGISPEIHDHVVMYPNTAVIGKSIISKGSIISQGTSVINQVTQKNKIVYQGTDKELVYKVPQGSIIDYFFR